MAAALGSGFRDAVFDAKQPEPVFDRFLRVLQPPAAPALVVLEDVHWADDATLVLLRFFGRRAALTRGLTSVTSPTATTRPAVTTPCAPSWATSPRRTACTA